jgi:hypothetical protein
MKYFIFVYCEGTESKFAVVGKENDKIKIVHTFSVTLSASTVAKKDLSKGEVNFDSLESEGLNLDKIEGVDVSLNIEQETDLVMISKGLARFKLSNCSFIPVISDPAVNYHVFEGNPELDKNKLLDIIIQDLYKSKNISVTKDRIDFVTLNDKSNLAIFAEGSIPCADLVNSLAALEAKRYYKIETIKSAEVALANYVSHTVKFFPEDYSLIIHIGKEASKLIFLEGQSLKHIGTTLDIGTKNLHTYDVYFSKILLEMENGGIPRLDNVILCGDDRSENIVLSFYGTFPEANVIELKFDGFDLSEISEEDKENISSYSVPIASAYEYFAELKKEFFGINILPTEIKENQKFLQFGWHSYLMLVLFFFAAFGITVMVLSNISEMNKLDLEIQRLSDMKKRNEEILSQMTPLQEKISNFDNTQAILDSAAAGTEIWSNSLQNVADFVERRRDFWISHLDSKDNTTMLLKGYTLSRRSLTEFARYSNTSILNNITYEPLREKSAFSFNMNIQLNKNKAE